jgi:hypothetical protein
MASEINAQNEKRRKRITRWADDIEGKWARVNEEERRVITRGMSRILSEILHLRESSSTKVTTEHDRRRRLAQSMADFIYFCTYNGRWSTQCNVYATVLITRMHNAAPHAFNNKNWKQVM